VQRRVLEFVMNEKLQAAQGKKPGVNLSDRVSCLAFRNRTAVKASKQSGLTKFKPSLPLSPKEPSYCTTSYKSHLLYSPLLTV
jgi:hypothetical protein